MTLRVLVTLEPKPKQLWRLLKRHNGRILAVAVVIEVDNAAQVGALARHYGLRLAQIPPGLLVQPYRRGEGEG